MAQANRRTSTKCSACGEANPPRFDICWSCGADLTGPRGIEMPIKPDQSSPAEIESITPSRGQMQRRLTSHAINRWNDWLELAAVVLFTCVARYASQLLSQPQVTHNITWSALAASIPHYAGLTILLWLLIRRDRAALQPEPLKNSHWLQEILFGAAIAAASTCATLMISAIGSGISIDTGFPRFLVEAPAERNVCIEIIYAFFAVIYEEAVFRVYLQSKLQSLMPGKVVIAVLLSAAIFAVVHRFSLKGTLNAFASGLIFGAAYQTRRRFPRIVLGHWFHNLYAILLR
jgi:membrane protease YdiL (CAAX protease family)